MNTIIALLLQYGYAGMFVAAFVAGSVFPFSSEAVMVGLQLAGLAPLPLFLSATTGNFLGSMFNYWVGSLGRLEWVERYLKIAPHRVMAAQQWLAGRGAWMGFFSFIPVLGSVICVTLGFMHASRWRTALSIFLGKALRYALLAWAVENL